ncbi:GNAT family N-acetyltransferase [uncultured Bifidobacterium sp.]|uniref:GNAT family N-acetyltransferase n=1 Tax=uncultured Bifidobacterium sp. TaxID=165187 RepID=UPI003426AC00
MRLIERVKNLLGGASKRDIDKVRLRIVPAADQIQADMIWRLLAEQIADRWDESIPQPAPNPDNLFGPTLIGAWSDDRLVGGAFVMPDTQDSKQLRDVGAYQAAHAIERYCCLVQGVAVVPERRRQGIGLQVKRFVDRWAAQHGACIVSGVPTNQAARHMNKRAHHDVLPPGVALVLDVPDDDRRVMITLPMLTDKITDASWAVRVVAQPDCPAILVGQGGTVPEGGSHDEQGRVRWLAYAGRFR